jgi:sugar-specific transcriptional regulator TrmB
LFWQLFFETYLCKKFFWLIIIAIMDTIKGFDKLGLTARDSRVYIALLKNGVSSIRTISEQTGINRGSTYESIKNLMAAGLVSFRQSNVNKKYFAEDPTKILSIIKRRKEELDELNEQTKALIPTLVPKAAYMPYANIKFYEDHEGVAVILRDVLETTGKLDKKVYYAISSKQMRNYLYKKFPNFTKQRIAKNIFVKVIAIGEGGEPDQISSRKWLEPKDGRQTTSYNLIYGNKFAMIALNDNLNPYGIIIEDMGVANTQKLIFDQLWESL